MQKKGTRTFSHSSFWGPNFVFLINLPKNRHKKVSDEVLYISVGHLSPEIYQILSKIDFPKNMNFVKKKTCQIRVFNFELFWVQKSAKMKVSRQSVADFYKLHHDKGKAFTVKNFKESNFNKRTLYKMMNIYTKMFVNLRNKINKANENGLDSLLKR